VGYLSQGRCRSLEDADPTVASLLRRQDVLAVFGELALRSDSLDEILHEGCRLVRDALGTDLSKVMELGGDGTTLLVRAGVGWKEGIVGKVRVEAVDGSFEDYALRTGKPIVSGDIRTERRFRYADFLKDNGVEAMASVIILGEKDQPPFGILQVGSRHPRDFDERDTRFLQGYANLIAAAVCRLRVSHGIRRAATHDSATALPNRALFRERFDAALCEARETGRPVSLLLIDLDRFKQINDVLGHQVGDAALYAFAARLVEALPGAALVARLGGDEFVAILPGADGASATAQAKQVLDALKQSFGVGGRNIDLSASMGISTFPDHGTAATHLIKNADLALYAAKKKGGNTARIYEPVLRAEQQGQLAMLRHARAAIHGGWIAPFYQPQIALATGAVRGFEALLRWHHPRAGLQYPATIAYAFDDPGTAGHIGAAILHSALADLRRWIASGVSVGKLAINVSSAEFRDPDYAGRLLGRLAGHGLSPKLIEIEITEAAFLDVGAGNVVATLRTLRAAGATVALDDFGTGCSSLRHLHDLPVDTIKIDRSFVAGIEKASRDRSITEAILALASALGMTTIAEGVETSGQAAFLKERGCAFAQGFLIAPALDALQAAALVQDGMLNPTAGSAEP
jgi:diguanylate cyclase (GGDEF)-like protein